MWNNKNKAVTFSFDDGVTQDIRLIEILNKYNLKGTFNLNSSLLAKDNFLDRNGKRVSHKKLFVEEVKNLYHGHEVAVHTLTHPNLTTLEENDIVYQVETDREVLSNIVGYEVIGMAYPCGGVNNDDRVAKIIKEKTGVKYARTITSTYNFDRQDNLYRFNPSIYYIEENFEKIVDEFLALKTNEKKLLYVWGHSYEMDAGYITWEKFERICKKLSFHKDIFYGTNKQCLLDDF